VSIFLDLYRFALLMCLISCSLSLIKASFFAVDSDKQRGLTVVLCCVVLWRYAGQQCQTLVSRAGDVWG